MTSPFVVYGLYAIDDPAHQIRYVGQTCRGMARRWSQHLREARVGRQTPLYRWMRKHEVAYRVLEEHESETLLDDAELRLISQYCTFGGNGLNLTLGGKWGNDGVTQRGSSNAYSRLTESDVAEIVRYLNAGEAHDSIASRFGVSRPCISNISQGSTWSHVTEGILERGTARTPRTGSRRGSLAGNSKLNESIVAQIKIEYAPAIGVTTYSLAERYGVSPNTIQRIILGQTWAHVMPEWEAPEANSKPQALLSEADVARIKGLLAAGARGVGAYLSREYGVSQMTISDIRRGATWREVEPEFV